MLGLLAAAMQRWLAVWDCGVGFAVCARHGLSGAGPAGEGCTVKTEAERIDGTFVGLDPGGALRVLDQRDGNAR